MDGVDILLRVALVGLVAWLLIDLIPMPEHVKKVLIAAAVIIAIIIVLPLVGTLIGHVE